MKIGMGSEIADRSFTLAVELVGDVGRALGRFENWPLVDYGGSTPAHLVAEHRSDVVVALPRRAKL
jgi:hypothetical protein